MRNQCIFCVLPTKFLSFDENFEKFYESHSIWWFTMHWLPVSTVTRFVKWCFGFYKEYLFSSHVDIMIANAFFWGV